MGWATALKFAKPALEIGSALFGGSQGRNAAGATTRAGEQTVQAWNTARDQAQGYLSPYRDYGQGAGGLGGLAALAGGDYSGFMGSPDYQVGMDQVMNNVASKQAAKFNLFSGGGGIDRDRAVADYATGKMGDYRNFLQWGAGMGQQASNQSGMYGMQAAQGIGQGLQGIANGANQRAGANAGLGYSLANIGGQYPPGMFGSSYGGGSSGSTGSSGSFGMPAYNSGNNPFYSGNWT
jgi:hypothetical protein